MDSKRYDAFCTSIRQAWTHEEGVLLRMKTSSHGKKTWRLCAGNHRNEGLVARNVVLWDGDTMLYDGPLLSKGLRKLLNRKEICHIELTSSRLLDQGRRGVFRCLKDPSKCQAKCRLRNKKEIQISPEVPVCIA